MELEQDYLTEPEEAAADLAHNSTERVIDEAVRRVYVASGGDLYAYFVKLRDQQKLAGNQLDLPFTRHNNTTRR